MACGHAKFTGEVGCCVATSGPGAVHLLNGLYDAKLDHQPVVAVVGRQKRLSLGTPYQQEIALLQLFADVSEFCEMVVHPGQARHVIDRAFRAALTTRSVATIIIPNDIQEEAQPSPPREHGSVFSSVGWSRPRVLPDLDELRKAADVLNASTAPRRPCAGRPRATAAPSSRSARRWPGAASRSRRCTAGPSTPSRGSPSRCAASCSMTAAACG